MLEAETATRRWGRAHAVQRFGRSPSHHGSDDRPLRPTVGSNRARSMQRDAAASVPRAVQRPRGPVLDASRKGQAPAARRISGSRLESIAMRFTKMHGLGNDYIYVNAFEERVSDAAALSRAMSDRHLGVGADGLILILPSRNADVRMEMYNADGSRAQMCGNGIRCVAKYAVEHRLAEGPELRIETDAGVKRAVCEMEGDRVERVRVDMGRPSLRAVDLPARVPQESIIEATHDFDGTTRVLTCVSMGNPHAVVFVNNLEEVSLPEVGPIIENAPMFPERINVHFAHVDSRTHVTMKTWERGSGATRACGTGACAVAVAGSVTGRTQRRISVTLPGGDLQIEWADDDTVYMTGPAVEVFSGEWSEARTGQG